MTQEKIRLCEFFFFPLAKTIFDVFTNSSISFFIQAGTLSVWKKSCLLDVTDLLRKLIELYSAHFSGRSDFILRCHFFFFFFCEYKDGILLSSLLAIKKTPKAPISWTKMQCIQLLLFTK